MVAWFDAEARDLPWRAESRDPWAVLVSEVMLQQTPVARVVDVFQEWMTRWPTPGELAQAAPGDAVRMWGRLGYPRRALRLHAAAGAVVERFGGELPRTYEELITLPGVGDYTTSAVLAFAHRQRIPVLDTNVRRVLNRARQGRAFPPSAAPVRAERAALIELLPSRGPAAARFSEALMELGALICTARDPRCADCPLRGECQWLAAGRPDNQHPAARQPAFIGSDRQARGAILALLRSQDEPITQSAVDAVWADAEQRARAQASLVADGLIRVRGALVSLPD
mgnify:CR=1 FL=1